MQFIDNLGGSDFRPLHDALAAGVNQDVVVAVRIGDPDHAVAPTLTLTSAFNVIRGDYLRRRQLYV